MRVLSLCEVQVFAAGLTNSHCSGPCAAGYYCPSGSTSATQHECGGPGVFCPVGSAAPVPVLQGHYTSVTELLHAYLASKATHSLHARQNLLIDPDNPDGTGEGTRSTAAHSHPGPYQSSNSGPLGSLGDGG